MATVDRDLPRNISRIADEHGLTRHEVRTLIVEHSVPTMVIGTARVVAASDWPRLERLVKRLVGRKARSAAPAPAPAPSSAPSSASASRPSNQ